MRYQTTMGLIHDPYNLMHYYGDMENLDYKESVTTVYPNAQCFMFNEGYCIMEIGEVERALLSKGKIFSKWPVCYSRWQDTPHQAWLNAWERIQLDMINKLEA